MKLNVQVNVARGTKSTMAFRAVVGGYIRVSGGGIGIGYENAVGESMELLVTTEAVVEAYAKWAALAEQAEREDAPCAR